MSNKSAKRKSDGTFGDSNSSSSNHTHHPAKKSRIDTTPQRYPPSLQSTITPRLPPITTDLENLVFTHPSHKQRDPDSAIDTNYDRLECLGDAHIELIATQIIFQKFPTFGAGRISAARESLVKNETLSQYTIMYGFDKKLKVGSNITDARNNTPAGPKGLVKIYGDVFEAYCAAVVLSDPTNGEVTLKKWLTELWKSKLDEIKPDTVDMKSKERLAAKVMMKGVQLQYVEERKPQIHKGKGLETYFVGIFLTGWGYQNQHLGSGKGPSKVVAGQAAAANALENHPLIDDIIVKRDAAWEARLAAKQEEEGVGGVVVLPV